MTAIDTSNEAVERLLDGVTPGPWRVGPVDDTRVEDADGNEVAQIDGDYNSPELWPKMEANARFIAAARDLVPALLKERDALRTRIDELEAFITDFASAKFDSLPLLLGRHPADEPDPVTDATVVWSWQEDANELLKGEKK